MMIHTTLASLHVHYKLNLYKYLYTKNGANEITASSFIDYSSFSLSIFGFGGMGGGPPRANRIPTLGNHTIRLVYVTGNPPGLKVDPAPAPAIPVPVTRAGCARGFSQNRR